MLPQKLGRIAFIIGLSLVGLSACSPTKEVAPDPTSRMHMPSQQERVALETKLSQLGHNVDLKAILATGNARKASSTYAGTWKMTGWMQFPSGQYEWASGQFGYGAYDFPAQGYTDVFQSIRHYWVPDYYHNLVLGAANPTGSFDVQTNKKYNYTAYWSGSQYTVSGITIQAGVDLYVLYESQGFMLVMSQYPNSQYWDYTFYIR